MNFLEPAFIGFTLDVVGKIMVAYTAVRVHYRVWQEHAVDEKVFGAMRREQLLAIIGIALIVIGYFLQAPSKLQ